GSHFGGIARDDARRDGENQGERRAGQDVFITGSTHAKFLLKSRAKRRTCRGDRVRANGTGRKPRRLRSTGASTATSPRRKACSGPGSDVHGAPPNPADRPPPQGFSPVMVLEHIGRGGGPIGSKGAAAGGAKARLVNGFLSDLAGRSRGAGLG